MSVVCIPHSCTIFALLIFSFIFCSLTDDMRSSALVYNIVAESSKFVFVGLKNYLGEELASKLFEAISKFRTTSLKRKHVQDNCPTPSALGVKSEWCANQKKYAVFCHRPASNKLHVSLQVAAFGNFLQELKEGEPDVHCIKIAQGLMLEMSDVFKNEGDRLETFSKIMTNLFRDFNVLSVSWGSAPNANTDLSVLAENNVLINFKLKNELSEGGKEANLQNIGYYIHLQKKYTLSNEPAPMLLVSLVGCHYIQVFGAAWNNNGVCVDPLSPPVSLLFVPEDPNNGIRTVAQMLTALLHGAQDLKIHYSLPDEQRCRCKWPYFDMNGRLQYIKQDSQKCRLFEAMCNEQKCVVKFVSSHYGTDVQQYLAQKNLAPQIISHTQLSGGWNAVVMEKVDGNKFPVEPTQTQKKSLLDAVDYLHLGGYVHGDLRPQNIMVLPDDTVRIVDFDWAGRAGHAKYPLDINISASHNWHSGVAYGGYIQKEHDKYQIARY